MPTFEDPRQHAVEAHQALRALAHATRVFTNLADTYPVIGDLLAAARSLRQVVDQLAAAHITHRARAHDDAGNQAVGDAAALAAGDELHQVGTLLIEVEARLDAASQHTGRIAWHSETGPAGMNTPDAARTTTHAGTLTLTVWPDTPVGDHQRYAYRIQETTGHTISGRDLFTGAGDQVEPAQALRDRAGYLSATGQARQHALDHPISTPGTRACSPTTSLRPLA